MPKYKLTIEYDGTSYSGWQGQTNARSIQGTLIETAQRVLECDVDIQGAGRTDAGVHALGQVAHLEVPKKIPLRVILEKLNDELPSNINILRVEEAKADFHARHHAKGRSYLYILSQKRTAFGKRYVWWVRDTLNTEAMEAVMKLYQGFHDFSSFADKRREKGASSLVQIDHATIKTCDDLILFRFAGSHFLWKMVRRLVGVAVEAGRGKLSLKDIEAMMKEPSDIPARYTAPPSGLFLEQVLYEGDTWQPFAVPSWPALSHNITEDRHRHSAKKITPGKRPPLKKIIDISS
jgi:tRNA pseudouridine38-40 synthase